MAFIKREVFCHKNNADFEREDNTYGLMSSVDKNGNLVEAANRPEAIAHIDYFDSGVIKYYAKRNLRKEFFNPKSHMHEQNRELRGQKIWEFTKINKEALFHYLKWVDSGIESELRLARRAMQG